MALKVGGVDPTEAQREDFRAGIGLGSAATMEAAAFAPAVVAQQLLDHAATPHITLAERAKLGMLQPPESPALCLRSGRSLVGWSLVNGGGATGTMAMVATSPFGRPALKVTVPNDTGTVDVIADGLGLAAFTAGRANIVAHVYIEDELGIKQAQIHVGNDTALTRNMGATYNLSNNNIQRANGHHIISLNPDNQSLGNTLLTTDSVERWRMRLFGQPAGGVVWIEGLYIPGPVEPWMIVTFDDADLSMYTAAHAELQARGLKGTFGVNYNDVGANASLYVTQAQLQEMYDYGHDITSHNRTNTAYAAQTPPTAQPTDADRLTYCTEFRFTRSAWRSVGWRRALGYHPFVQGGHDGALVDAMKAHGMTLGRTVGPGHIEPFRAHLHSTIRQRQLGSSFSLSTAQTWVTMAKSRAQDFAVMGHILGNTSSTVTWTRSDFAALLDYALAEGLRVGSVSEWAAARGVAV